MQVNTFRSGRDAELEMHPTVKPTALVIDAIKDCSRRGEIVLDAFAGSGTTIMAAVSPQGTGHRTGPSLRRRRDPPVAVLHRANRRDGCNRRDVCGSGRTPWRSIAVSDVESTKTAGAQR